LGLYYAGLLLDVIASKPGTGEEAGVSGTYAVEAVRSLQHDPDPANWTQAKLWKTTSGKGKEHNHQMDVVLSLWRNKLIVGS